MSKREEGFEAGLNRFLGLEVPKALEVPKEEEKLAEGEEEQFSKTFEGFKPHFEEKEQK